MLRRNFLGIVALTLLCAAALAAQVKEMPKTPVKPINAPKAVDINSAAESDIAAVGIPGTVAKKIIDANFDLSSKILVMSEDYCNIFELIFVDLRANQLSAEQVLDINAFLTFCAKNPVAF